MTQLASGTAVDVVSPTQEALGNQRTPSPLINFSTNTAQTAKTNMARIKKLKEDAAAEVNQEKNQKKVE